MKGKFTPQEIIRRAEKADARKENWRDIYEQCYEMALPQRNLYSGYWETKTPGQKKTNKVFDSTAINSTQRFANRLQSSLFPPYRNWCRLIVGDVAKDEIDNPEELQKALDMYTEKMFTVIRQTNFDLSISEFLLDLCVGTACLMIQKGPSDDIPIKFEAIPQYLISIEEGANGKVENVYRKIKVRADVIQRTWPDAVLGEQLKKIIEDKPEEEVHLLEATIYKPELEKWCYHIIYNKNGYSKGQQASELVYRLLEDTPFVVCRYSKVAGEVFGRGPLVSCIDDIKTLNKTKEMILKNASLAIAGVYTARDDGVLNPANIRIAPGSVIPVASNGGGQGPSLTPLPRSSDFNVAQIIIKDLVDNIKTTLLDDSIPPDSASARSATEVMERMKSLATNLGSAFGRLITEALIPIVQRTLKVMDDQKIIDLPLRVDGNVVKIVPQSPLAQSQNMTDLQNVMQFIQIAQGLGPVGQVAVNQDAVLDYLANKMGVPGSILNSKQQRKVIVEQMAQTAVQAQQSQQAPDEDINAA